MQQQRWLLALIFILVIGAIALVADVPYKLGLGIKTGLQLGLDLKGGAQLTIQVKPTEEIKTISQKQLDAVKTVMENRVNALGVSEPIVQTVGQDKISVQLPGVTDPQQAERILGGTAQLEFRAQRQGTEGQFAVEYQLQRQTKENLEIIRKSNDPEKEQKILDLTKSLEKSDQAILALFEPAAITGKNLKDANPTPNQAGTQWEVAIRFDDKGGNDFAQLTQKLAGTGRSIGIFLDNSLISAPTVDVKFATTGITGGSAVITGNFTIETANDLAVQLRGGSLPFPVEVVENRTVGATLGQDSIRRSILAGIAGLVLVFIFIGVYYRLPGLIADVALAIYTILTLGCFSLIGVTLTLPGIAGFILSIGMAVDANVLIFERTREELQAGNTLYRSVEGGFYRAFSSILDSNVTTLIACAALFWLGSGLVKGFALTLAIGVLVSMFTALTCSRTLLLLVVLNFPGIRQRPELFSPNLPKQIVNS
jgi:preprotein translocase subunit SecD